MKVCVIPIANAKSGGYSGFQLLELLEIGPKIVHVQH